MAAAAAVPRLILAQGVHVYHFWCRAGPPDQGGVRSETALKQLIESIGYHCRRSATPPARSPATRRRRLNETVIMLVVLALIDVVMISNLLIMVIVGGYETFVTA
jgi:hypothetical protein